jgi:non-heme chloroperoxidase
VIASLTGGMSLSYCERGPASGQAVVLLPGPTDSWRSYEPILGSMPEDLRVVAVSLRGHGASSKPTSGYAIEDLASDVMPFLDALEISRAVLVGHSGSCLVARRIALDEPDRVAGLFLEASPTTLRGHERLQRFVAELPDPIDRDFARSFVADTSSDALDPDLVELLVDDVLHVPHAAWTEMFTSLLDHDDTTALAQVPVPVALVWGDDDPLVPRAMQDELLRLLPDAQLLVYAHVGHTPRWEQPERFAADLLAFVRRVLPR